MSRTAGNEDNDGESDLEPNGNNLAAFDFTERVASSKL